jgi:A/G-specific adenine glycosylase
MMTSIAEALLEWYGTQGRDLPWRRTRDPYAIWVSEVMLQQTQVETVVPYYLRWMERFPSIEALAEAPIDDVLNLWEGLGYYRRAHGLHQTARRLWEAGRVTLPDTVPELEALPGIGPYTARAVGAIAFGRDVLALDGNLRRVLARLFDVSQDVTTPEGERRLRDLGESLVPKGKASVFNQALMDLGASVCIPRAPKCVECPLRPMCAAFEGGVQEERPLRKPRTAPPHRELVQAVLRRAGRVLVGRRPRGGLLGGLWAFPGAVLVSGESPRVGLRRAVGENMGMKMVTIWELGDVDHAYTHYSVTAHAFVCDVGAGSPTCNDLEALRWVDVSQLDGLAMGKVDRRIATLLAGG